MLTILLLTAANIFMTFAWYGHLKFKHVDMWKVILISWLIALPEYILQVPANRWGHRQFTAAQLITLREVISLGVFCAFAALYLGEPLKWNTLLGFGLIVLAVFVIFHK